MGTMLRKAPRETKTLVDAADAAKAQLKLPDDLKAVYDKAYDRVVSKRGRDWAGLEPLWTGVNDRMKALVAFVRSTRTGSRFRAIAGSSPAIRRCWRGCRSC